MDIDTLDDPMDDGTIPLAPLQFDPLCELSGRTYPSRGSDYDDYYESLLAWDGAVLNEMVG